MVRIITWLLTHRKSLIKAIFAASVGFLLLFSGILYKQNQKLSQSLEKAETNVLAYQGLLNDSQQANNVLRLTVDELSCQNDKLVNQLDSVREELKIKSKNLQYAATQLQTLNVKQSKPVKDSIIYITKDSIYKDTIKFNDFTLVSYDITKDSVRIGLDIKNTQYLYVFKDKRYKNKKSFIKRLFTLDFKKITTYKYQIINTNDLIDTDSVKVVEIINK